MKYFCVLWWSSSSLSRMHSSAAEHILRPLLLKTWRTGARGVATLIHHSSCRHFCFSSSRLFLRIICHDRFRRVLSPPLSFVTKDATRIARWREAKESPPRSPFTSVPFSVEKEVCGATSATRMRRESKRECTGSLCAGRPRHTAVNSNFSSFSHY